MISSDSLSVYQVDDPSGEGNGDDLVSHTRITYTYGGSCRTCTFREFGGMDGGTATLAVRNGSWQAPAGDALRCAARRAHRMPARLALKLVPHVTLQIWEGVGPGAKRLESVSVAYVRMLCSAACLTTGLPACKAWAG